MIQDLMNVLSLTVNIQARQVLEIDTLHYLATECTFQCCLCLCTFLHL